jgi:serine/threonine-protein kinase
MSSVQGSSRLGARFGPYELHSLIGMGGMGEVYRAYDTVKERMVAVKVLRGDVASDKSYQERFRRDCRNRTSSRCTTSVISTARFTSTCGWSTVRA